MATADLSAVFVALDVALIEAGADGLFHVSQELPEWCSGFGLTSGLTVDRNTLEEIFPFLSVFLADADEFWREKRRGCLESETWMQRDLGGKERVLLATALTTGSTSYLLLAIPAVRWEQQQSVLQRVRDKSLAYERLEYHAQQVEVRKREVERLNELKGDFIASMSHELRTPLNSILGFSDLMIQGRAGPLNQRQQDFMGHVKGAADHLLNLINDVLDLAKIEAGRIQLHPELLYLQAELEDVLPVLRSIALQKDISLAVAPGDHTLFADRLRFRQILYNLVSNALKFTPSKGRVEVNAASEGEWTTVTVADTGAGIALEEQTAIFDKYYQAGSRRAPRDGTGLGLAITKSLVEQHNGSIWVESEGAGTGSRFKFTLRARPPADDACEALDVLDGVEHQAASLVIALVEDDPSARRLVEAILVPPYTMCSYERGVDAVREIPKLRPHVILLDISLPDISGVDVLSQLRAHKDVRDVPVVAFSAHAMKDDRQQLLAAGFDDIVSKPITDSVELKRTVATLCGRTRSRVMPSSGA
jgi:signal transduction histidine kinase/CheY-like chemotaxis protein